MSSSPIPEQQPSEAAAELPDQLRAGSAGLSGQGAGSALARLRELEQKRDSETQGPHAGTSDEEA